jgi:N-acetylglucosaminyldiphosphoundecaprenol N-acetyl-beta-D-mannosaminyltransferase
VIKYGANFMIGFLVFFLAAGGFFALSRLLARRFGDRRARGLRAEGAAFVFSVLAATLLGLHWSNYDSLALFPAVGPPSVAILLLCGVLYLAASTRSALQLPAIVADIAVVLAAFFAVSFFNGMTIDVPRLPFSNKLIALHSWSVPLTVLWVWAVSRMTAALNRTPQVTGGYLSLVGLSLLTMWMLRGTTNYAIVPLSSAALAGAGFVSLALALKNRAFDLGWPAALAMGFLVAQVSVVGVFKNLTFSVLLLLLLTFGLPLLDVSFYCLRAAQRGQKVKWEQSHLRLHEALLQRGIAPMKVSLLYLAMAFFMTLVGLLFIATGMWPLWVRVPLFLALVFFGIVVFFSLARVLMKPRADDDSMPGDIEAFGMRISPVSMQQALDRIETFIKEKKPRHVVTSDANAILRVQEDHEYADIVRRAALITPDGYGVMWGARLLNLPIYERVTGVDMVTGICERAAKSGYSIYILGSEPGVAATAAANLQAKYPGLRVAGTHHGFWRRDGQEEGLDAAQSDARMAEQVGRAAPDVLFVAMGIPAQEKFIAAQMERMNVPVALGVGGSFDVYSGKYNRAPEHIQRLGLEWIYRVWIDPVRWRRMGYVPRFMMLALREWIFGPPKARKG